MADNREAMKKLASLRRRRRAEKKTNALFQIEGNWSDVQQNFHAGYRQTLRQRASSAECFHVLLNSLADFYRRTTDESCPEAERQGLVNGFLKKHFDRLFSDAAGPLFDDGAPQQQQQQLVASALHLEKQRLECEVRCLVEIHLLRAFPIPLHQTAVAQKLRALYYASDPVRMRKFLDETVCDEFMDDLPLYLARIYEELLLELPPDLSEFQSMEGREDDKRGSGLAERNRFASQLEDLFAMADDDAGEEQQPTFSLSIKAAYSFASRATTAAAATSSDGAVLGAPQKERRNSKRKREVLDRPYESSKAKLQVDAAPKTARCRLVNVPETPDEKLVQRNRRRSMAAEAEDEVVEQTPIGKIRRGGRNEDSRLSQLLKCEEEKMRLATSQQSATSSTTAGGDSRRASSASAKQAPRTAQRRLKL